MPKSTPTSIRFDEQKLKFIKDRENLDSPQKIVNFLLDQYWWKNQTFVLDPIKTAQTITEKPKQSQEQKIDQFQAYTNEINQAGSFEQLGAIMREVQKDKSLSLQEKMKLEYLGQQVRKEINF